MATGARRTVAGMDRGCIVRSGDPFPWGWLLVVIIGGAILAVFGGSGGSSVPAGTTSNTTPVLSGNEVLSRNQANFLSDVTNEFYDCMGAGSCTFTTDNSTESNRTDVRGNDNVIVGSDGTRLCADPTTGIYSTCQEGP
jgi:hypothetical protein